MDRSVESRSDSHGRNKENLNEGSLRLILHCTITSSPEPPPGGHGVSEKLKMTQQSPLSDAKSVHCFNEAQLSHGTPSSKENMTSRDTDKGLGASQKTPLLTVIKEGDNLRVKVALPPAQLLSQETNQILIAAQPTAQPGPINQSMVKGLTRILFSTQSPFTNLSSDIELHSDIPILKFAYKNSNLDVEPSNLISHQLPATGQGVSFRVTELQQTPHSAPASQNPNKEYTQGSDRGLREMQPIPQVGVKEGINKALTNPISTPDTMNTQGIYHEVKCTEENSQSATTNQKNTNCEFSKSQLGFGASSTNQDAERGLSNTKQNSQIVVVTEDSSIKVLLTLSAPQISTTGNIVKQEHKATQLAPQSATLNLSLDRKLNKTQQAHQLFNSPPATQGVKQGSKPAHFTAQTFIIHQFGTFKGVDKKDKLATQPTTQPSNENNNCRPNVTQLTPQSATPSQRTVCSVAATSQLINHEAQAPSQTSRLNESPPINQPAADRQRTEQSSSFSLLKSYPMTTSGAVNGRFYHVVESAGSSEPLTLFKQADSEKGVDHIRLVVSSLVHMKKPF